jgi:arylsulfatase A-like enzyme
VSARVPEDLPVWRRLLYSRLFRVLLAVGIVAFFLAQSIQIGTDPRPLGSSDDIAGVGNRPDLNLLFILVDTLRADRLSSYGYERETSPNIDALAASGVRFAQQMSQSSWTKCSMASLWTALYPARTGVLRSPQAIPEAARMPAEILRDAGYRTFGIWRNGWVAPTFGFAQGFELYQSPQASPIPASVRRENPTAGVAGTDQDQVRSALQFFRTHGDERWFLYLHLMDVHQYVYDEQTGIFGTSYSDIYDNSIRWVDRILGVLIQELDARGLRQKTLVVLAADHGEAFGEHGREGHARDVYGEVTTTPLILSFPFRLDPGLVVEAPTQNVDIWPTLLDLLGLPGLEGVDGRSRVPEIEAAVRGEGGSASDELHIAHIDQAWGRVRQPPRPMVSLTEGPYRLIYRAAAPKQSELFDRAQDPREQRDLAGDEPEVLEQLMERAKSYLDNSAAPWGAAPEVELDEAELEQLRALGYQVE